MPPGQFSHNYTTNLCLFSWFIMSLFSKLVLLCIPYLGEKVEMVGLHASMCWPAPGILGLFPSFCLLVKRKLLVFFCFVNLGFGGCKIWYGFILVWLFVHVLAPISKVLAFVFMFTRSNGTVLNDIFFERKKFLMHLFIKIEIMILLNLDRILDHDLQMALTTPLRIFDMMPILGNWVPEIFEFAENLILQ